MNTDIKKLYDAEPDSPLYVAINRVLVGNDPNLMRMMKQASSKMCLTTALSDGGMGKPGLRPGQHASCQRETGTIVHPRPPGTE